MPTIEEVRRNQSSSQAPSKAILLCATVLTAFPQPASSGQIPLHLKNVVISAIHSVQASERIIQRIWDLSQDQDLRDEDEPAPPHEVIDRAIQLIRDADILMGRAMPSGQVSTFFGEVNVTWRADDRIIRFACFPNRPSVLQSGSVSMPIGAYRSEANPTAEHLAESLKSLIPQDDPEEQRFPG